MDKLTVVADDVYCKLNYKYYNPPLQSLGGLYDGLAFYTLH